MNKKKVFLLVVCLTTALAIGCGKEEKIPADNKEVEKTEEQKQADSKNEQVSEKDNQQEILKIYSVDSEFGNIKYEEVRVDDVSSEEIWTLLQEKSVITAECKINSCEINEVVADDLFKE